jgi:hypothetical protein
MAVMQQTIQHRTHRRHISQQPPQSSTGRFDVSSVLARS